MRKAGRTSSASRISWLLLLAIDFGSKVELSLCRDSDSVSASSWNYTKQSTLNNIRQERLPTQVCFSGITDTL